ncbi:MAG: hypothetical protein JWN44_5414 [Myxococcales bacterium]|nr:hypothetical protein [Myxococcales bacterium]
MSVGAGWYPDPNDVRWLRWWDGASWTTDVQMAGPPAAPPIPGPETTAPTVVDARRELAALQAQIVETRDVMLLQEVGVYEYSHPLDSSVEYRQALVKTQSEMKGLIKSGGAVAGTKKWAINGSEKDGTKMVADFQKLMLRAYNTEADNLVRTLRPYALDSAIERLEKMRAAISKLGASMKIEITDAYHVLRVGELRLTSDYLAKGAEEKEREREEKARLKEEEIARREYERERERLEKEKAHYEAALNALRMKGDAAAVAKMTAELTQIEEAITGVTNRAANIRAGYVYVISNIGSFGKTVVKIGLTRRLDPLDRVRELGDASVPFRFDVHAMIFSDDAVGLETKLHQQFAAVRVNLVNAHREFFYADPNQVKDALVKLQGSLLTYNESPEAVEWHQSEGERAKRTALSPR